MAEQTEVSARRSGSVSRTSSVLEAVGSRAEPTTVLVYSQNFIPGIDPRIKMGSLV